MRGSLFCWMLSGCFRLVLAVGCLAAIAGCGRSPIEPRLVLGDNVEKPVLTTESPGAEDIRYGFEGGRVVKVDGIFHLFTSEMVDDPMWVKMRLAHWSSPDGTNWTRLGTLFESSGDLTGNDERAALWSPMPVYDDSKQRWDLFYVAYHSQPNTESQFLLNHDGRIWRATSEVPGPTGIGGPYTDQGIILKPGPQSESWEGLQGTDSFFPYPVGEAWYAFYGSAKTGSLPIESWLVGLAQAPALEGPWKRCPDLNPAPIEKRFIENPIVLQERPGLYLAVYDNDQPDSIGYTFSTDGAHWSPGRSLQIQPRPGSWSKEVRTPLGLIPGDKNEFTLFYTGFEQKPDWDRIMAGTPGEITCAIGRASLRLVWEPVQRYQPDTE